MKITKTVYNLQIFFLSSGYSHSHKRGIYRFRGGDVRLRQALYLMCYLKIQQSVLDQSAVPKTSDPFLLCHSILHDLSSIFIVKNQIKRPRFFHGG